MDGKTGHDKDGNTRCQEVCMETPVHGSGEPVTHKVKIPLLNIAMISHLQIDNINVDFQMEITDASSSKDLDNM